MVSQETIICLIPKATILLTLSNAKQAHVKADLNKAASKSEHKSGKTLTMLSNIGNIIVFLYPETH